MRRSSLKSWPKAAWVSSPASSAAWCLWSTSPGVAAGALKLDGQTLANIFLGKVTKWNDPALVALNGGVQLPDAKITVVHRSDGSGTTFNFVNYLSKVSDEWKTKVGEGTAVKWPVGIGGKGNEGVAAYVKQIKAASAMWSCPMRCRTR